MISRRLFNTGLVSVFGFLAQKNPLESLIPKASLSQISDSTVLKSTELLSWGSKIFLTDIVDGKSIKNFFVLNVKFHFNKKITENSYTAIERTMTFQGYCEANSTITFGDVKKISLDDFMTSFKIFSYDTKEQILPTEMVVGKSYNIEMYNYLGELVCTYVNFFYKSYGDYKYHVENS